MQKMGQARVVCNGKVKEVPYEKVIFKEQSKMELVTLQTTFLLAKTMLFTEPLLWTRCWTKYFLITSKFYFNSTSGYRSFLFPS